METTREHGEQPVATLMEAWTLSVHDMVDASPEQLTHKQVQRARGGRRLTLRMMQKVMRALNVAIWTGLPDEGKEVFVEYTTADLFSYAKGGGRDDWKDPNAALREEAS